MNYLIQNASVVNEGEIFEADVLIENGLIGEIARGGSRGSYSRCHHTSVCAQRRGVLPLIGTRRAARSQDRGPTPRHAHLHSSGTRSFPQ